MAPWRDPVLLDAIDEARQAGLARVLGLLAAAVLLFVGAWAWTVILSTVVAP